MFNLGLAEAYAEAVENPIPYERSVDSLVELREKLGVLAHQDVETMLIGKHAPIELDIACVETEIRYAKLIADREGENVERAKNLYDRELELDRLDTGFKLRDLRSAHADAKDDQEQAEERLVVLQPDVDLVASVRDKQKELTASYRHKTRIIGGAVAFLVSLAVAYGVKNDNATEALAAIPVVTAAGAGLGECAGRGTYRGRAHRIAKSKFEQAKTDTVILKPYVR